MHSNQIKELGYKCTLYVDFESKFGSHTSKLANYSLPRCN